MGFSLRPLGRRLWEGITPQDEGAQRRANANLQRANQAVQKPAQYGVLRNQQAKNQFVKSQQPVKFNAPKAAAQSFGNAAVSVPKSIVKPFWESGDIVKSGVQLGSANLTGNVQAANNARLNRDTSYQESMFAPAISRTYTRLSEVPGLGDMLAPGKRQANKILESKLQDSQKLADITTDTKAREIAAGIKSGKYDRDRGNQAIQQILEQGRAPSQVLDQFYNQKLQSAGFDKNMSAGRMGAATSGDMATVASLFIAPQSGASLKGMVGAGQITAKQAMQRGAKEALTNSVLGGGGNAASAYGQGASAGESLKAGVTGAGLSTLLMGAGYLKAAKGKPKVNLKQDINTSRISPDKIRVLSELHDSLLPDSKITRTAEMVKTAHEIYKKTGNKDLINGSPEAKKNAILDIIDAYESSRGSVSDLGKVKKPSIFKPLDSEGKVPMDSPLLPLNKLVKDKSSKPKVGNLDESLSMDKYRKRAANPIASEAPVDPLVSTRGKVAKLTDAQVSKQMVEDLGLSKAAADRLIKLNGKVDTTARLYSSKDLIRGADNPDAYATGIINKVRADGKAALNQNMPPVKPKVKAKSDFVEIPDANGNIIRIPRSEWDAEAGLPKQFTKEPTAPKPGTDQFAEGVDDLPTKPKVNAKATEESVFDQRLKLAKEKAAKEIEALNAEVKKAGYTPEEITAMQRAQVDGAYQMTPKELELANAYTARFDKTKAIYEAETGTTIGQQDYFTPQRKVGQTEEITRENLLDFGSRNKRKGLIEAADMDYGNDPKIDYIVRGENRSLVIQKAIDDAARIDGRVVTPKKVEAAAQTLNDLHKKIQGSAQKGKISTNDSLEMLHRMGKDEGYTQVRNDFKPSIIDQSPQAMMEKAGVFRNGFEQFDNSTGYASELVTLINQNKIPRQQIPAAFEKFVRSRLPDAEQSSITNASRYISRRLDVGGATDEGMTALFDRGFKNVAKSEMLKLGKTTQFSSTKMRAVINEQINGRAFIDANSKNLGQNMDSFVSERINVSLRGANVVSALFELGDEANIGAKYGYGNLDYVLNKVDGDRFHFSKKYGEAGAHFLSDDIPQVSKMNEIMSNPDWGMARKTYELYRTAENKVLLFRYIEEYKTEQFFRAAEKHYRGKGLQGGELVDRVMSDFNTTLLPHKLATATRVLGKAPKSLSQYLNWSIQATKRMGRTLSGSDTGGKFADMTRGGRIARGVSTELVPKVMSAALLGVPIMQVMGMRDFTGTTQGDFTGIPDEDKNALDQLVGVLNLSPITGMGSNYYYANRRNQIADQNKAEGEDYKAERDPNDTIAGVTKKNAEMLIPFKTQYNKTKQVVDAKKKGYYESRDGRVQTEAPQGAEYLASLVTGKSYSPTMRDYQDNPSALSVVQGKAKPIDLLKKNQSVSNFNQAIGGKPTTNYKRPLTKTYSDAYKEADKAMRTSLLDGGRKYNKTLDDLKRNNPDAYNSYIRAMDDHVSPEYWREITGGSSKKDADLTIFNMSKALKKQLLSDMNKAGKNKDGKYNYDPLYDLPDNQARIVLQQKATITGDDLALRNILYKEKWYQDYMDKQSAYYDKKPASDDEFKTTQRQKEWNKYNDEYNSLTGVKNDRLKKDYPLVYQLKQYKYGSPESKAFLKNNYAAWKAQSDKLDKQKLIAINKMRKIEGAEPMGENAYAQATEFANTSDTATKKYNNWGTSSGSTASSYSGKSLTSVKGKVAAPKLSVKAPVKLKGDAKAVAIGKPKVTIKKALT